MSSFPSATHRFVQVGTPREKKRRVPPLPPVSRPPSPPASSHSLSRAGLDNRGVCSRGPGSARVVRGGQPTDRAQSISIPALTSPPLPHAAAIAAITNAEHRFRGDSRPLSRTRAPPRPCPPSPVTTGKGSRLPRDGGEGARAHGLRRGGSQSLGVVRARVSEPRAGLVRAAGQGELAGRRGPSGAAVARSATMVVALRGSSCSSPA